VAPSYVCQSDRMVRCAAYRAGPPGFRKAYNVINMLQCLSCIGGMIAVHYQGPEASSGGLPTGAFFWLPDATTRVQQHFQAAPSSSALIVSDLVSTPSRAAIPANSAAGKMMLCARTRVMSLAPERTLKESSPCKFRCPIGLRWLFTGIQRLESFHPIV
jgi:hypothetical protein